MYYRSSGCHIFSIIIAHVALWTCGLLINNPIVIVYMTPIERLVTTVLAGNDYHCLPQVRLATAQSHITAVLDEDASMANSVAKLVEVV